LLIGTFHSVMNSPSVKSALAGDSMCTTPDVGEEPAADDQYALVTQRRQPPPDLQQPIRLQVRHRHLQYGDVGDREHLHQRHKGTVVRPPAGNVLYAMTGAAQQLAYVVGERGSAGRRVGHAVVVLGEASEAVHQRHSRGSAERERGLLPMRRDHQDRLARGRAQA
jgi:hypothetical protein